MSDIYKQIFYSRVYRDTGYRGLQVAAVYAPGFGAEWSATEASLGNTDLAKLLMFHPDIVRFVQDVPVERRTESKLKAVLDRIGVTDYVYCGAVKDLRIKWIDEGTRFIITQYDGNERVEVYDPSDFFAA